MTASTERRVRIANAPVSYGAFERTVGRPDVPTSEAVLAAISDAGYEGVDLGPVGYLAGRAGLGHALAAHGLALAGGYVELPLSDPVALHGAWPALDAVLDEFDAAATSTGSMPPPRPTLAHTPTPERAAHPGQAAHDPSLALRPAAWSALTDGVAQALRRCRVRGYEPAFHPELGTSIESPSEIEALLETTEVGLCVDTGHLLAAGGDPAAVIVARIDRINQIHVKDARRDRMAEIISRDEPVDAIWERGVFCSLGTGDLDIPGVLEALRTAGYHGWIVVEQDSLPGDAATFEAAAHAQRANRRYLERCGYRVD